MEKARFVVRFGILLESIKELEVDHLTYKVFSDGEEEVTITFTNGYIKKVCVTGDSKLAIIQDVIKHL